jgi:predicted lipid-binding transport protein (Tim44 family)
MQRLFVALFATVVGLGLLVQDAEAKRLGGGRSFGMSRDTTTMKQASPTPTAPAAPTQGATAAKPAATPQAAAPKPAGASRWLGPIAGLAAGIGLAALLSHFGLGEGVATFLMMALLAVAVIVVLRLIFRKREPESRLQYAAAGPDADNVSHFEPAAAGSGAASAAIANVPAGFDTEGFLRQAKLNFIRLQAANDAGNLEDIKAFTAPEVFAEIQMQYEERGRAKQETDVAQLDAALVDLTTEAGRHVASVRFFGLIRESAAAAPEAFEEVWHLTKPVDGSQGWLVSGIQQLQ